MRGAGRTPPDDHRLRPSGPGTAVFVTAVVGIGLAVNLTVKKFQSDYVCDAAPFSSCDDAQRWGIASDCERIFNSTYADILGYPITLYAAAFYAVIALAALSILLRRDWFYGQAARVIIAGSFIAPLVSILLFAIARAQFGTFCWLCGWLYAISFVLPICSGVMGREGPGPDLRYLIEFIRRSRTAQFKSAVTVVSCGMFLLGVQHWLYAASADSTQSCQADITDLPDTDLVIGADQRPAWIFASFLDVSCSHCKQQFRAFEELLAIYPKQLQIRIYHFPRDPACAGGDERFDSIAHTAAIENRTCRATRAIHCAEEIGRRHQGPGLGVRMMERVFRLQDVRPAPWFSAERLEGQFKLLTQHLPEPNDILDEWRGCLDEPTTTARIRSHMRFAYNQGMRRTPRLYALQVRGDVPDKARARMFEGDKDLSVFKRLLRGVAR